MTSTLTATTGEGSYDDTIGCPTGDGPSWRYGYTGRSTATQGVLGGTWSGTAAFHDASDGRFRGAFAEPGSGRVRITTPDRGSADLAFTGPGDCDNADLTLGTDGAGDPTVSGSVPLTATGGSGALRGITGTGTADITSLGLGPGADNTANLEIDANLTALPPGLTVGTPTASYIGVVDFLAGRATVRIPVSNTGPKATVGDAFDVKVTAVTVSPQGTLLGPPVTLTVGVAGPVTGPPIALGRIDTGADAATAIVEVANTVVGAEYTLTITVSGKDALDGARPPVTQTRTFRAPLVPDLILLPLAPII